MYFYLFGEGEERNNYFYSVIQIPLQKISSGLCDRLKCSIDVWEGGKSPLFPQTMGKKLLFSTAKLE